MSVTRFSVILILLLTFGYYVFAQSVNQPDTENGYRGVTLSLVSQQCISKDRVFAIGDDDFSNVSDMFVIIRLENQGKENIYYLSEDVRKSILPAGRQLYRDVNNVEWQTVYGDSNHEESFTLDDYEWLLLPPKSAIEFKVLDSSDRKGEHAIAVFLNTAPENKNRTELISNTYIPDKCALSEK